MSADQKTYLVHPKTGGGKPIKVRIDPEFESLIAPLQPNERAVLEASIRERGVHDRLIAWWDGVGSVDEVVLLDGHTRLGILAALGAELAATGGRPWLAADISIRDSESIPDREAALLWIEEHQIGRRNLTDDQRAIVWDSIRERRSAIAKRERAANARAVQNGPRLSAKTTDKPPESSTKRDIRREVATESGLPESKLRAVAKLNRRSPELAQAVRAGKMTLRDATKQTKPKPAAEPAAEPVKALSHLKTLRIWFQTKFPRFLLRASEADYAGQHGRMGKYDIQLMGLTPKEIKAVGNALAVEPEPEPATSAVEQM